MSDEKFDPVFKSYLVPILSLIGVLGVAYFGYKEVDRNNQQADTVGLYARITDLERQLDEKRLIISDRDRMVSDGLLLQQRQTIQLERLTEIVDQNVNHRDYMQQLIDSFPVPIIIKSIVHSDGKKLFPTMMVNDSYARRYSISKYKYRNRTGDDIWNPLMAAQIQTRNMKVYDSRGSTYTTECHPNTPGSYVEVCTPVARAYAEMLDGNGAIFTLIFDGLQFIDESKRYSAGEGQAPPKAE